MPILLCKNNDSGSFFCKCHLQPLIIGWVFCCSRWPVPFLPKIQTPFLQTIMTWLCLFLDSDIITIPNICYRATNPFIVVLLFVFVIKYSIYCGLQWVWKASKQTWRANNQSKYKDHGFTKQIHSVNRMACQRSKPNEYL